MIEEGLATSSNKQHCDSCENTDKWHLCKAGSFSYGESPRTPPLEGTSLHRRNNSVERPWGILSLFTTCLRLWVKSHCHLLPHLQNMPLKAVEKKEESHKTVKRKSVVGFLHSVNHTGSPQDESYSHSYFIPGQNNKSPKHKLERKRKKKKAKKKAAYNSRHNTINNKHNWHQYLHFPYLQLWKVRTGVFSFVDLFSTKLKWSNHKYMSNSLLWPTKTYFGSQYSYILQALSYIGQFVMISSVPKLVTRSVREHCTENYKQLKPLAILKKAIYFNRVATISYRIHSISNNKIDMHSKITPSFFSKVTDMTWIHSCK